MREDHTVGAKEDAVADADECAVLLVDVQLVNEIDVPTDVHPALPESLESMTTSRSIEASFQGRQNRDRPYAGSHNQMLSCSYAEEIQRKELGENAGADGPQLACSRGEPGSSGASSPQVGALAEPRDAYRQGCSSPAVHRGRFFVLLSRHHRRPLSLRPAVPDSRARRANGSVS